MPGCVPRRYGMKSEGQDAYKAMRDEKRRRERCRSPNPGATGRYNRVTMGA